MKVFDQQAQKQQFYVSDHELNIKHSQLQTKHKTVLFKALTYTQTSIKNPTNQSLLRVAIQRKWRMRQIYYRDKTINFSVGYKLIKIHQHDLTGIILKQ